MGWTGRAPAPDGSESTWGLARIRSTAMSRTSTVHAVTTIGIDMGKNTLHMIGLDTRGGIVLREKVSRGRINIEARELAALSYRYRSWDGDALRCSRTCGDRPRRETGATRVRKALSAGAQE